MIGEHDSTRRTRWLLQFALASSLVAFAVFGVVALMKIDAVAPALRTVHSSSAVVADAPKLADVEDMALERESLFMLAAAPEFSALSIPEKRNQLRQWCEAELGEAFAALGPEQQDLLVSNLALSLRDALGA
jgi:hypothetical protein